MSKSEDYLDGLLNSVMGEKKTETETEMPTKSEEDFLNEFENEILSDGDQDEFLRQLEDEMDGKSTEQTPAESKIDDKKAFLDNLDGIVSSVKEKLDEQETEEPKPKEPRRNGPCAHTGNVSSPSVIPTKTISGIISLLI